MITPSGKLIRAIPDDCINYEPIISKPTRVSSIKLPIIYECENEESRKGDPSGCGFCTNRVRSKE